jgi:dephospho-CoA kinase
MIIIGLTGSVGMGKSETCKYFRKKNIDVFDCDKQVSFLYEKKEIKKQIKQFFPSTFKKNKINKIELAQIVFNNKEKLKKLEKILHVNLSLKQKFWVRKKIGEKKKIVVFDVPLLFEKDNIKKYDFTIVVSCKKSIQKARVLKREGWNMARLEKTINVQMSDKIKNKLADKVIRTDRGKRYLLQELLYIINNIKIKKKRTTYKILKEF